MGRQRLWPLNPPTKMTQAMMTGNLMIMSIMIMTKITKMLTKVTQAMMIMRMLISLW